MQYLNRYNPIKLRTVTRFTNGIKQYIITAIDLKSRFAFGCTYDKLNSSNATDFMSKLTKVSPFEIRKIQTDNGSEFGGYFSARKKHFIRQPCDYRKKAVV